MSEKKLHRREIRLTEEQIQKVSDLAAAEDRSFPAMLRIMVDSYTHQPTCREHHSPATLDDTSIHVGSTPVPPQSHPSPQIPPYTETRAQVARLTTYHRDNVARDTRKQEQEHNVTQQRSIGHGGSALPGAVDWTPEQIREGQELCNDVLGMLDKVARGAPGYEGPRLDWFKGGIKYVDRAALLQQCLLNPERERWKRGVMWLLLAGQAKAQRLRMTDIAGAMRISEKHGQPKLLCAADALSGYRLTVGSMVTPQEVLDGTLPECWYGLRHGGETLTRSQAARVLSVMAADAPLQLQRLRTLISKAYQERLSISSVCHRRAVLYLLSEWPLSARYAGVLAPLIVDVTRELEAESETHDVEVAA